MPQQMMPRGRMYRYPQGRNAPDSSMSGIGMVSVPYDMGGIMPLRDAAVSQPIPIGALASALANASPTEQRTMLIVDLPTLTEKDKEDIMKWGVPNKIDMIALSFVRKGLDLVEVRKLLGEHVKNILLMSKWGWRCRAKLAIRGSSADPLIGLYEEGTHNVVDIPDCKAHHPSINAAVELLKRGIKILNIEPYDEDERTGYLRYVQMAVTTYNTSLPASERYRSGRVQVSLVWNSRSETSASSEKLNSLATLSRALL